MSISNSPDTLRLMGVTLNVLLMNAYDVRDTLISGAPSWAGKMRWDVVAKSLTPPATKDHATTRQQEEAEYQAELRSILGQRFHIKAHFEQKQLPVFDLVANKGKAKLCISTAPIEKRGTWSENLGELTATGITLRSFAEAITYDVGRVVIDKTGLHGEYDLTLKWSPGDEAAIANDSGMADVPPVLTTALQEQLGLKLVPSKGPVNTLVVDFVDIPTDN